MWRANDGMGWWMVFGSLIWLLFLGAVIYFIFSLLSGGRTGGPERGPAAPPPTDPLQIAKRRYAAGEITREEYQQVRDDLVAHPDRPPPPAVPGEPPAAPSEAPPAR